MSRIPGGCDVVIFDADGKRVFGLASYYNQSTVKRYSLQSGKFYLLSKWGCVLANAWGFSEVAPIEFLEEAKIALLVEGKEVVNIQEWAKNFSRPAGVKVVGAGEFPSYGNHR